MIGTTGFTHWTTSATIADAASSISHTARCVAANFDSADPRENLIHAEAIQLPSCYILIDKLFNIELGTYLFSH